MSQRRSLVRLLSCCCLLAGKARCLVHPLMRYGSRDRQDRIEDGGGPQDAAPPVSLVHLTVICPVMHSIYIYPRHPVTSPRPSATRSVSPHPTSKTTRPPPTLSPPAYLTRVPASPLVIQPYLPPTASKPSRALPPLSLHPSTSSGPATHFLCPLSLTSCSARRLASVAPQVGGGRAILLIDFSLRVWASSPSVWYCAVNWPYSPCMRPSDKPGFQYKARSALSRRRP